MLPSLGRLLLAWDWLLLLLLLLARLPLLC